MNITDILNKVLNNKKFIESLFKDDDFDMSLFEYRLGNVLKYYLITNDTNTTYTYPEIESLLERAKSASESMDSKEALDYILSHGYMTHSFNGNKRDIISKYGLSYTNSLTEEEKDKIKRKRLLLNKLEELTKLSPFLSGIDKEEEERLYITSPGTKTFYYALNGSPERLYMGPLFQEYSAPLPFIVGESKYDYYLRVLKRKLKDKYINEESKEYKEALSLGEEVLKEYISKKPLIALIKVSNIKDLYFSYAGFKPKRLSDRIKESITNYYSFFSNEDNVYIGGNGLDNLSTNDYSSITEISLLDVLDGFDLRNIYARSKGLPVGTLVDYNTCRLTNRSRLNDLINVIDHVTEIDDLNELERLYNIYGYLSTEKHKMFKKSYDVPLSDMYDMLLSVKSTKKALFEKESYKPNTYYKDTLLNVISDFERKSLINYMLDIDDDILDDKHQYKSLLHGVNHTRRVAFNVLLLTNKLKSFNRRDTQILLTIAKYHDIGRLNDGVDDSHGERSAFILSKTNELKDYDEEEKELIYFVIKEHSLNNKQNSIDIDNLPISKKARYKKFLSLFKDADKLDRVRLSTSPQIGLDTSRLSFNISKQYENVAYESYEKLLDLFSLLKKERLLEEMIETTKEYEVIAEFRRKLDAKRKELEERNRRVLEEIKEKEREMNNARNI